MLSPFHGRSSCLTTWQLRLADDGLPYPLHARRLNSLSSDPLFLGPLSLDPRSLGFRSPDIWSLDLRISSIRSLDPQSQDRTHRLVSHCLSRKSHRNSPFA